MGLMLPRDGSGWTETGMELQYTIILIEMENLMKGKSNNEKTSCSSN